MDNLFDTYMALLNMSEESLKMLVDIYNAGHMSNETTKQALEIIDGLPIDD